MSPRAAWRLEALGYAPVYDYTAGKADWLAAGLPTVTRRERPRRAADVMDRGVATCRPDQIIADIVATNVTADTWVVVNEHRVVLGRLRADDVDSADRRTVEEAMEPGPATVRADAPAAETVERMRSRGAASLIVSTPDGVLLGLLRAEATVDLDQPVESSPLTA
jgi:CBS-domain-containing membrane protein